MKNADREFYFGPTTRKLFVQEWGDIGQPAILLIHGFPGCADQGRLLTATPHLKNFRLISFDRPGYGRSNHQHSLSPLTAAAQIRDLVDFLDLDQISILSVSGGAPYAMALAYLLKERVKKMTSVAGVAPLTRGNFRYMNRQQKKAWALTRFVPSPVLRYSMQRMWKSGFDKIDQFLFTELDTFSPADQVVLQHPQMGPALLETIKIALAQGPHGILQDMKVYAKSWGFPLSEITCPVTLWHGSEDDVVHYRFAEDMKRNLSNPTYKFIEGEGHYSLPMNFRDEIIQDLLHHSQM